MGRLSSDASPLPCRQTGERALSTTIGRAHPIFFVGNAPMGHLPSIPRGRSAFFMLAQVVGEPWECSLKDPACQDWAWVSSMKLGVLIHTMDLSPCFCSSPCLFISSQVAKDELHSFIEDPRLRDLAVRML